MFDILAQLLPVVLLGGIGFWIWCLVDILKSDFKDGSTKLIWLLVVFFLSFLGVVLYFMIGKKQKIIQK
jgi:Phospholipase_D-nuclease N-terminal